MTESLLPFTVPRPSSTASLALLVPVAVIGKQVVRGIIRRRQESKGFPLPPGPKPLPLLGNVLSMDTVELFNSFAECYANYGKRQLGFESGRHYPGKIPARLRPTGETFEFDSVLGWTSTLLFYTLWRPLYALWRPLAFGALCDAAPRMVYTRQTLAATFLGFFPVF
ncbi:hypothetical protein BDN67DRAFT_984672 [Paxillus ammoniavirescens]|nr:hypothetical protein BDN67DRAFT_984672 [Paxillus ammoniavirescens]